MEKITLGNMSLMFAVFFLTSIVAIGFYQLILVMPQWFANMPESLSLISKSNTNAVQFWIPLQLLFLLSLVTTLIFNWGIPYRRMLILYTLGIYIAVMIVSATLLAPQIVALSKITPATPFSAQTAAIAHRWLTFSWLRIAALCVGNILLLLALAL